MTGEYENLRRVSLDFGNELGIAVLIPVCDKCGRFVKVDDGITANRESGRLRGNTQNDTLAVCHKCGRTTIPFEGWFSEEELAQ